MSLPPQLTASLVAGVGGGAAGPYAYLNDDFTVESPADPTERGWSLYKSGAIAEANVNTSALQLEPVQGGSGPDGSLWYTASIASQFDGMLVYKSIGPASGTPVSFDVRARLVALDSLEVDDPPVASGEYRYVVLAAHDPDRADLNYLHIGIGADPAGLNVEVKTTDSDGVTAESVFPVVGITGAGTGLEYDVRIVRRATDPQIFDCYYRAVGAEPLESNVGWTLHTTIDRTDANTPLRSVAVALPDDLDVGLGVYANPVVHDVHGRCVRFAATYTSD